MKMEGWWWGIVSALDKGRVFFESERFMPDHADSSPKPVVASYCTTFLKPEMLHIYRQITGLRRHETFVLTRERQHEADFPFPEVEVLPRARKNFLKRFWLKYVAGKPPVYYRGELQVILKVLVRRPADLMHIYFGHTGVHLLPFVKEWKKPCVVSFHGMDIQARPQQEGYDDQMRELLQAVPLVLARSQSLFAALKAWGCPAEKLRLNRTGIPLSAFPFQQRPMPADGSWRFVQACRLVPKKGLGTAIRAFAKFHAKHPRAKFRIAGEGPMKEELAGLIGELGLEGAVELRGFLSQADLAALYAGSHIFLHPSEMPPDQNQEGVPNSMLEAMATGLPVLATTHGGIPEAVAHERTGLLVSERDDEGLFRSMLQITEETDFLYILGQAAARTVREDFEQTAAIEKLEKIYDEARGMGKSEIRNSKSETIS
jgi:colanic acid/amylovoran biosynthesis glycosyltransferase